MSCTFSWCTNAQLEPNKASGSSSRCPPPAAYRPPPDVSHKILKILFLKLGGTTLGLEQQVDLEETMTNLSRTPSQGLNPRSTHICVMPWFIEVCFKRVDREWIVFALWSGTKCDGKWVCGHQDRKEGTLLRETRDQQGSGKPQGFQRGFPRGRGRGHGCLTPLNPSPSVTPYSLT